MENKPSIREERMKAGVEAGKPGAKARVEAPEAWMESAEPGTKAPEASVEATETSTEAAKGLGWAYGAQRHYQRDERRDSRL